VLDQGLSFSGGVSNYDALESGRDGPRRFRAPRRKAVEVFGYAGPVCRFLSAAGTILDVSATGVTVQGRFEELEGVSLGEALPFRIEQGAEIIYEGRVVLRRREKGSSLDQVAVSFVNAPVNLRDLAARNARARDFAQIKQIVARGDAEVPEAYRRTCADAVALLHKFRPILERFDQSRVEFDTLAGFEDVMETALAHVLPRWTQLVHEANARLREAIADPAVFGAMTRHAETVVTPLMVEERSWRHGYEKPFGYPGDYMFMDSVYRWRPEGETLFRKLIHVAGLHAAESLVSRMRHMERYLAKARERAVGATFDALNLGCGPATEMVARLGAPGPGPRQRFSVIDQDANALDFAMTAALKASSSSGRGDEFCAYHLSFVDLLRENRIYASLPKQDVIYSVGVIDYLNDRLVRRLIDRLKPKLKPGGTIVLANLSQSDASMMWQTAGILDWPLVYRTREDMKRLGEGHMATYETDATGGVEFISIASDG